MLQTKKKKVKPHQKDPPGGQAERKRIERSKKV